MIFMQARHELMAADPTNPLRAHYQRLVELEKHWSAPLVEKLETPSHDHGPLSVVAPILWLVSPLFR
jgi:hypothetical protein